MLDPERQQITLNIADTTIVTKILRKDEADIKAVEKRFNSLWKEWRLGFPKDDEYVVLAKVAFQYAKLYFDEVAKNQKREKELGDFMKHYEGEIDKILFDV